MKPLQSILSFVLAASFAPASHADAGLIGNDAAVSMVSGSASITGPSGIVDSDSFGAAAGASAFAEAVSPGPGFSDCGNLCAKSGAWGSLFVNVGQGLITAPLPGVAPVGSFTATASWSGRYTNTSSNAIDFSLLLYAGIDKAAGFDDSAVASYRYRLDGVEHVVRSDDASASLLGTHSQPVRSAVSFGPLAAGESIDLAFEAGISGRQTSLDTQSAFFELDIVMPDGLPGGGGVPPVSPVPEPGSWLMLLAGLGVLAVPARARRRRSAAPR